MLDYDPTTSLRHYPIPMARFGTNPYGGPRYRIVFAPSRRVLAGDGERFHWVKAYSKLGDVWILEAWMSGEDFCRMPRSKWDREMASILGPYPDRGEYDCCHVFIVPPDDCNIEKLISWVEEGRKRSFQDNLDACKADYEQDTKDRRREVEGRIYNTYPAWGVAPLASSHIARGTKTRPVIRSAEELGLPTGNNKFMTLRRENVRTTANDATNLKQDC